MQPKKNQVNTDDQSTVVSKNTDNDTTAVMPAPSRVPEVGEDEMKLIRSYWNSGSAALKRQAISRYASRTRMSEARAEQALNEWVRLLEQSK